MHFFIAPEQNNVGRLDQEETSITDLTCFFAFLLKSSIKCDFLLMLNLLRSGTNHKQP